MVDGDIVFRTGVGSELGAPTRGADIAFEVDERIGWSVVVTGIAHELPPHRWAEQVVLAAVPRWAPEGSTRVLHLATDIVSGRRILPA